MLTSSEPQTVAAPWLVFRRPSGDPQAAQARVRLFCFHHAGGSALAFRPWIAALPAWIDVCPVQLPGRGTRLLEAPYASMDDMAEECAAAVAPLCDRPVALFGHSMGAAAAFAVAQRLPVPPVHVFAAGRSAPTRTHPLCLHQRDDAALLDYMRRLGGTPDIVFGEPELMRQILAVLRADLRLNDLYRTDRALAGSALTVLGGADDPQVPPAALAGWHALAPDMRGPVLLPGGHFFTVTAADELHRIIVATLRHHA
jgi:medium-chain acyl-[acyl-carrier-protein] hydrolase